MSSHERTGWRDMAISQRHRLYGYDCPMFDIDFMCVEYDKSMPVCLYVANFLRLLCSIFYVKLRMQKKTAVQ